MRTGKKGKKLSCNVLIKETFYNYFTAKSSRDNEPVWKQSKFKMQFVLSAVQKEILTMWHKLALSVIPPVRTQHVILRHVSNLSWVIVSTLLTAEVKLNKIS